MLSRSKNYLLALYIVATSYIHTEYLYDQLLPKLTTSIYIENPTEQEQNLINTCRALSDGGTKFESIISENWQAINSINMFNFILPKYARTFTNFGYIGMARQCAQMTDDVNILNNRVTLTQFLCQNSDILSKISNILERCQDSEKTFTNLFRQISDEEQEEADKLEQKLYFSRFGLDRLNENSYALGATPRINQATSVGMIVIPQILASAIYMGYKQATEYADLTKWGFGGRIQKDNLSAEQEKRFQELDKLVTERKDLIIDGKYRQIAQDMIKDGVTNLPQSYYDFTTQTIPFVAHHIKENSLFKLCKKIQIENGSDPNSYTTTAKASAHAAFIVTFFGAFPALYTYSTYQQCKHTKEVFDLIHEKQCELISVAHLIKSLQVLQKTIHANPILQELMSKEDAKLTELFDPNSKKTSADLKNLINALLSSSFKGNDSYWLSQQGKILATHHLLVRIKNELVPYLETLGQIDAYLAVAKLYKEFQYHPNVKFCLPTFVNAVTPVLDAQEYWHPLIDANKVVTNSLTMNHDYAANLIITGPNAGGKTTSLMSLIINVIFAQSFGIAPSASLQLTPFAKIHSYLDITTNLQEGLSLFAAEVDRAKKLKTSILSCKPGQKTFTIIDEIFSGTDPKVASEVGFNFAQQLGDMIHSMTIITTHFPALTKLEEDTHHYVNFKVADATIHADGSITYPFKLVPGISSQNIATQMLHNQGII